jgi:uncharacterized protein YndB with AHSA1/START domain
MLRSGENGGNAVKIVYESEQPVSNEACAAATGKTMDEWFAVMDAFGGPARGRRELANHLYGEHKVDIWWAQTLNAEYEARHGLQEKDGRARGYFICSTKTIAAPVEAVYGAWVEAESLCRWFGEGTAAQVVDGGAFTNPDGNSGTYRRVRENRDLRFTWVGASGDESQVEVQISDKGKGKSGLLVSHDRIQSRAEADGLRAAWAQALSRLKDLLENPAGRGA